MPDATTYLVDPGDTTLPCADQSVGMILCIQVFAVIPADWFAREAARVLQPGGILVGEFNNQWSWRGSLHHLVTRLRGGFDYYADAYPPWKKQFESQGFEVTFERGLCWSPFGRHSNSPLIGLFTRLEQLFGLRHLPTFSPTVIFIARRTG